MPRSLACAALCGLTLLLATAAAASTWGGHNGDIRLSFTEGPEFTHVMEQEPLPRVGVIVELYAYLCDVDQVASEGEKFLSVGGWELQLAVDGAEWDILDTELPQDALNAGTGKGVMYVGKYTGVPFEDGTAKLMRWRIRLHGDPENVVFRLEPSGVNSCDVLPDCRGSDTQAVWAGSGASGQAGMLFSAGYVPAYLNWGDDAPEVEPVRGKTTWRDRGIFTFDD